MQTIVNVVLALINFYSILIVVYVLMSWIPQGVAGIVEDIRGVLASLCEPYLSVFRRIIPPLGMVDFSPIVAILVLELIGWLVAAIL